MSDGSSSTQIGECGILSDQEVAIVDSLDSITTTNSDEDDGSSDCSSDVGSSYISDPDEEPISIVTNINRPSPVNPAGVGDEEEVEEKSPTGGRIAKDTGCCLYSAITAIFVMVVLLGIVLIVTGPVLGLSFPPLLRSNTPVILPPIEHNYLTANFSDQVDEDVIHSSNQPDADYPEQYDPGSDVNNQTSDSFEYDDYLDQEHPLQTNLTDYLTAINNTVGIFNESVIEDLANLSPEALRTKYVAYVPIPLKIDDDEHTDYHDDVDDINTDIHDRNDDDNYNSNVDDDTYYDEEVLMTPRSSSIRRRPSATVDKVLLPIVMVPETSSLGEQRSKSSQGSDSWRSDDVSEDRPNYPPRRFDEDQSQIRTMEDDEGDLTSSPSLRIPGLNPPRRGGHRPGGDRKRGPGIDYRMFGSLGNQENRRNRRPNRPRPRDRDRFRPRDDFGRTTSLNPQRVLPPPSRGSRPRFNKGSNRQRTGEGREGSPALYIRPPPRPRPRHTHPARQRVQRPLPVQESWLNRQRTRTVDPPATSTKRPAYSYPRDAMSIQDIISYMTSMSHSNEQTTKKPLTPTGPEHRSAVWTTPDDYYTSNNNQRQGESYPSILPPPPSMGISRAQDSLPVESHTRGVSSGSSSNPYSFKLDVYPIRDSLGGGSSSSSSSNYVPPGPSYRQQSVLPPSNYRYRPSSNTSPYYENRQPSGDSSGSLSGIDFSYKIDYRESDRNNWSYSSYSSSSADPYYYRSQRRPHGSGSQEQTRYRDNDEDRDDMPLPLAFRPRRPETTTTAKPKLIVHLNVFNQKNGRNRYAEERRDNQEEEDYYSPSDIYRAVLRNNAAKTSHDHEGGDDNIMLSGQSRVDTFSQHQMEAAGMSDSAGSSSSSTNSFNSYDNHNMAASSSPADQYYRSVGMRRSSAPSSAINNSNNNYRLSIQSRNFYPAIDDDVPEPLPMPMASASDCNSNSGVNCTQGSVNKTQTAPLVSS